MSIMELMDKAIEAHHANGTHPGELKLTRKAYNDLKMEVLQKFSGFTVSSSGEPKYYDIPIVVVDDHVIA